MEFSLVSVIIPAYNAAPYVGQAIESVLAQTYPNFELIVVDDGSTDETAQIIKQFGDVVHYVYQPNGGLSSARNTAIQNSHGDVIALLDADDLWAPRYLEAMINFWRATPCFGAVYCGYQFVNANGEIVGMPSAKVVPPDKFLETLIQQGNWLVPSAVMFRRDLSKSENIFDESIGPVADTDLWIRLSSRAGFAGSPEVLVKYRCHNGNMSKNPNMMINAGLLLVEKRYGGPDGNPSEWSIDKRCSYINLYWAGVIQYLAYGDLETSVNYFLQLFDLSQYTALSLGFWRSVVRLHIPLEYQNDPHKLPDWARSEEDVSKLINAISKYSYMLTGLRELLHRIEGTAFLGFADEAGRNGQLYKAFVWLWKSMKSNPTIVCSRPYWGTITRSLMSGKYRMQA